MWSVQALDPFSDFVMFPGEQNERSAVTPQDEKQAKLARFLLM